MKIPGFNAEAGLYKTTGLYDMKGASGRKVADEILPQQLDWEIRCTPCRGGREFCLDIIYEETCWYDGRLGDWRCGRIGHIIRKGWWPCT